MNETSELLEKFYFTDKQARNIHSLLFTILNSQARYERVSPLLTYTGIMPVGTKGRKAIKPEG
jgi:hypothetical protein